MNEQKLFALLERIAIALEASGHRATSKIACCPACLKQFGKAHGRQKYCGKFCAHIARQKAQAEWAQKRRAYTEAERALELMRVEGETEVLHAE